MKSLILLILIVLSLGNIGCEKENLAIDKQFTRYPHSIQKPSDSYLPMKIGNYWKNNRDNYTEIIDTIRIKDSLFYIFYSLIGGDGISIRYLQIDENNKLIERFPNNPELTYTRANFNSKIGDKFYTLGDKTEYDSEVRIIYKRNEIIKFEYKMGYSFGYYTYVEQYKKGLGFYGMWKEIKINDEIYRFQ